VLICPDAFSQLIQGNHSENGQEWFTGQVKSVDVGEFVYQNFKEEIGKEHRLICTKYFQVQMIFRIIQRNLSEKEL